MKVHYGINQTYTVTENIAVGPTTESTPKRYPISPHDDTNTKYVAMNGNDTTGTGTAANPYATIEKALTTLGGAFTKITIIRSGYVGDLIFDAPDSPLITNTILQTELGEYAVIKRDGVAEAATSSANQNWNKIAYEDTGKWFVAACDGNKLYRSQDGVSWALSNSAVDNWLCVAAGNGRFIAGAQYFGTPTQSLYYSTDNGLNWTICTTQPTYDNWYDIHYANGRWVAVGFGTSVGLPGIYYSDDGDNFYAANAPTNTTNIKSVTYHDGLWVAGGRILYKSEDGINWEICDTRVGDWTEVIYGYDRWLATDNTSQQIYYSLDTSPNWIPCSSDLKAWLTIAYAEGIYIAAGNTTKLYYSIDGENFTELTGTTSLIWNHILSVEDFMVGAPDSAQKIRNIYNAVIKIDYNPAASLTINGFWIDGQDKVSTGIVAVGDAGLLIYNCGFRNLLSIGITIKNSVTLVTIRRTIFKDLEWALLGLTSYSVYYSLFTNITGTACEATGVAGAGFSHCTFYKCTVAIHLKSTGTLHTVIDCLFAKCGYAHISDVVDKVLQYCVVNGSLEKTTVDANSIVGAKILFHDVDNDDFHIRHTEEGYEIPSPGVLGSSDTPAQDMGCYDVEFTEFNLERIIYLFHGKQNSVTRAKIPVKPDSGYTLGSDFRRHVFDYLWQFNIESKNIDFTDSMYHMINSANDNGIIQCFPVDYGVRTPLFQGTFTWLDWAGAANQSRAKLYIINKNEFLLTRLFFYQERPEGWWIFIIGVASSEAWATTGIPFKIVEWDDDRNFILEATQAPPYTLSPPDGNYSYKIVKAMWAGVLQYQGIDSATGYLDFQLAAQTTGNLFVPDEWEGFWIHLDYTDVMGSRIYYRIRTNSVNHIYCDDPLGNVGSVSSPNNYHMAIDMMMTRSEPNELNMAPIEKDGEHGKFGNDWYPTNVTREVNTYHDKMGYLAYNAKTKKLTLNECKNEYIEDGL